MRIYKDSHRYLLTKCPEADLDFLPDEEYFNSMFETMYEAEGIGLSANQVGLLSRFFIMDISKRGYKKYKRVCINPKILAYSGDFVKFNEGCLSYSGQVVEKTRCNQIVVSYYDKNRKLVKETLKGIEAIVFQHELNHLDGINFITGEAPLKD